MSIVSYFRTTLKLLLGLGKEEDEFAVTYINVLIIAILVGSIFTVIPGLFLIWILTLAT